MANPIAACVLGVLALCATASAQRIEILPDVFPPGELPPRDHAMLLVDPRTLDWGEGEVRLRAYFVVDGEDPVDVTDGATWSSSDPKAAAFTHPGVLLFSSDTSVDVTARFSSVESDAFSIDAPPLKKDVQPDEADADNAPPPEPPPISWEDADANGTPDVIDEMLARHGINPYLLPRSSDEAGARDTNP